MEKTNKIFRTEIAETIFNNKYKHEHAETWDELAVTLVNDVCQSFISQEEKDELIKMISEMEFIPGGRYIYYAGRPNKYFNNCYLLKSEEDSREDWSNLSWKAQSCLMTGGGIGNDYSIYRAEGEPIKKTGGVASGPLSAMNMINEIGRNVMQGGSRRSAIYASLNWRHGDINKFLKVKDWHNTVVAGTGGKTIADLKEADFNYPAPLDMTNISLNYDNKFLEEVLENPYESWKTKDKEPKMTGKIPDTFYENVLQALRTGEPGMSFNFFDQENETLRNACTEVTSSDDSDVCNLGSVNMSRIDSIERFERVVELGTKFLLCGTLRAHLPYDKVRKTREKNRRLGLGLMGVHEWLLKKNYRYEVTPELHDWLKVYRDVSTVTGTDLANKLDISVPVAFRAIAPTGTIGMLASTTTGIEPLFAVAYKRRYLKGSSKWHYQYVVDGTAKVLIETYGLDPSKIESAVDLEKDYERRIKFQADVQDYVDMAISSTLNLSNWGSEYNNEAMAMDFAKTLAKYAHRLRGFTCYPSGSRGGQPLTSVPYEVAISHKGVEFTEHDICDISGHGGSCGI